MSKTATSFLLKTVILGIILLASLSVYNVYKVYTRPDNTKFFYPTKEDTDAYQAAADTFLSVLKKRDDQVILLSDTNHRDLVLVDFLSDDRILKGLAEMGFKNIFIESRHEFQAFADQVAAGTMTPLEYAAAKKAEYKKFGADLNVERGVFDARLVQQATKHGIKIISSEHQLPDLEAHNNSVIYMRDIEKLHHNMMQDLRNKYYFTHPLALLKEAYHHLKGDIPKEDMRQMRTVLGYKLLKRQSPYTRTIETSRRKALEIRLSHDIKLAHFIKEQTGTGRAIVLYGASHGRNHCDLDQHLGTERIEIFSNMLNAKLGWQNTYILNEEFAPSLVIRTGKLFKKDEIHDNISTEYQIPARYQVNICNKK